MSEPDGSKRRKRAATLVALVVVVVIAPLLGVYAFSPVMFASGLEPYQLAVALAVMLAETLAIAALAWLASRSRD